MTENLEKFASDYKAMQETVTRRMTICAGTGCIANGSLKLYEALLEEIKKAGIDVVVELKSEDTHKKSLLSKSIAITVMHIWRSFASALCGEWTTSVYFFSTREVTSYIASLNIARLFLKYV